MKIIIILGIGLLTALLVFAICIVIAYCLMGIIIREERERLEA